MTNIKDTNDSDKILNLLKQYFEKQTQSEQETKEVFKEMPLPPKYDVKLKDRVKDLNHVPANKDNDEKSVVIFKDVVFYKLLSYFVFELVFSVAFTFLGYIQIYTPPLTIAKLLSSVFLFMTGFIGWIFVLTHGIKVIPRIFFKLNEKQIKDLLKVTMFTQTGKLKIFFVKPSVDADFSYNKGLYVVDDNAKYWDGGYYNSYYVEGLPAPLKLKRKSNVQDYYKSVEKIKEALLNGQGFNDIQETDIENLISFSHSAKQLGEYKKDKMFSDMHKSKDGDKILMAVMGFGIVGFICMVIVVLLVFILG